MGAETSRRSELASLVDMAQARLRSHPTSVEEWRAIERAASRITVLAGQEATAQAEKIAAMMAREEDRS